MYRNYAEYEREYNEKVKVIPKLRKMTLNEFLRDNYRDKVEFYLMEEYNLPPFHEIFYDGVESLESEELTEEEIEAQNLQNKIYDLIDVGFDNQIAVQRASRKVFNTLKEMGKTKES